MTDMQLREKVTEQARSWLGASEANGQYWSIVEIYNQYARQHGGYIMQKPDPWCAAFASAVFIACGMPQIVPIEVSCPRMVIQAEKRGLWIEDDNYLPTPGDLILYDWTDSGMGDSKGNPGHVGVVCSVASDTIFAVEGNASDAVRQITRTRNQRYIRGYIVPDYKSAASDEDEPQPQPEPQPDDPDDKDPRLALPMLQRGDRGRPVQAMQGVLIALCYSCGWYGADGDFGGATYAALCRFQSDCGLEPDGVCGPRTWYALLFG